MFEALTSPIIQNSKHLWGNQKSFHSFFVRFFCFLTWHRRVHKSFRNFVFFAAENVFCQKKRRHVLSEKGWNCLVIAVCTWRNQRLLTQFSWKLRFLMRFSCERSENGFILWLTISGLQSLNAASVHKVEAHNSHRPKHCVESSMHNNRVYIFIFPAVTSSVHAGSFSMPDSRQSLRHEAAVSRER